MRLRGFERLDYNKFMYRLSLEGENKRLIELDDNARAYNFFFENQIDIELVKNVLEKKRNKFIPVIISEGSYAGLYMYTKNQMLNSCYKYSGYTCDKFNFSYHERLSSLLILSDIMICDGSRKLNEIKYLSNLCKMFGVDPYNFDEIVEEESIDFETTHAIIGNLSLEKKKILVYMAHTMCQADEVYQEEEIQMMTKLGTILRLENEIITQNDFNKIAKELNSKGIDMTQASLIEN